MDIKVSPAGSYMQQPNILQEPI